MRQRPRRFAYGVLLVSAFALSCALNLHAQEVALTGYVMDLGSAQWLRPEFARLLHADTRSFANILRARLKPAVTMGEHVTLGAEYEVAWSRFGAGIFTVQPDLRHRQWTPLRWVITESDAGNVIHFIDRLALTLGCDDGSVVLGRQRISWGTGRVWNPTDLFHPLNSAVFGKIEKDGVDAISAKYAFGSFTDVQCVVNVAEADRRINAALRFRTNAAEQDLSLIVGRFDGCAIVGADLAGNLFDAGVRGEILYTFDERLHGMETIQTIAGIDYQFTADLYLALEYHFNGRGSAQPSGYNLTLLSSGRILNLGRNYLAAITTVQLHPLLLVTGGGTVSLTDGSTFYNLAATWSLHDEAALSCGAMLFAGDAGDEYWYYPRVLFLRGEWYF